MIKRVSCLLGLCLVASIANAGYGEINKVGDLRQKNNVKTVQSTVTDSPTWKAVSKNAKYYVVEDKNLEAKALAKQKHDEQLSVAAEKAKLKAEKEKAKAEAKEQKAKAKAEAKAQKAKAKAEAKNQKLVEKVDSNNNQDQVLNTAVQQFVSSVSENTVI